MKIEIRMAQDRDMNFIRSSWFRAQRKQRHGIEANIYEAHMPLRISKLLSNESTFVAYLPEVPDEILGWACGSTLFNAHAIHFIYVKSTYRRQRIGSRLAEALHSPREYTCVVTEKSGRAFCEKPFLQYNPFLLER